MEFENTRGQHEVGRATRQYEWERGSE